MELAAALARLVADRAARERFLADPEGWVAPLDPADAHALLAIPRPSLVRYAESLLDKRTDELARAIPRSVGLFPPLLAIYRAWLARHPCPTGEDVLTPGLREALRALPVLVEAAEPEWVGELVAYEALRGASRRDGRPRRLRARWALHVLLEGLERGEVPLDPDEDPQEYTFP